MADVLGRAVLDHFLGRQTEPLMIHNTYGEPEEMPVEVFFRESEDLTTLEHLALIECKGTTLDVGAGAGALSLILQSRGIQVTALEPSPGCVEVLERSGIRNVIRETLATHHARYDTLLVMMNGLGLAGNTSHLIHFLKKCMARLHPKGQILIDSSDISYLYENQLEQPKDHYYGELSYQYEYKNQRSEWFDWLYMDQQTLKKHCLETQLCCEILHEENDQYLACITSL